MSEPSTARRSKVELALRATQSLSLADGLTSLLASLGYRSDKTADLGATPIEFATNLQQFGKGTRRLDPKKAALDDWKACAMLFQLTN